MSHARTVDELRSRVPALVDLAVLGLVVAAAMPCALLTPPSEATSALIYAGRVMLTGGVPYVDVLSTDGPIALVIGALSAFTGGAGPLALLVGLAVVASAAILHHELSLAFDRGSSLVAIVLGVSGAYVFQPDGGQALLALPLHFVALAGLLHFIRLQTASGLVAIGLALGATFLIALDRAFLPLLLVVAAVAMAARWGAWRAAGVIAGSTFAVLLPLAAIVTLLGAFGDMVGQYLLGYVPTLSLPEMSQRIPSALSHYLLGTWISAVALAGCLIAYLQTWPGTFDATPSFADPFGGTDGDWRSAGVLVPLLLIGFALDLTGFLLIDSDGSSMPRLIPLMIWFAAVAFHAVDTPLASWHGTPASPVRRAAGFAFLLVAVTALLSPMTRPHGHGAIARAEAMLARQLAPGDRLQVLGAGSVLYNRLGVFSPSPDFAVTPLPPGLNEGRGERLLAQLQLRPPTFIVECEPDARLSIGDAERPDFAPTKLWLANRYRKIDEFVVDGDTVRIHRLCAGPC
ncbi:MAG: hypothetical protein GC199_02165 [Alphaproteobacteria bacterium]|nr:hypothetical protein [Alphaproteobacteria bacterium]